MPAAVSGLTSVPASILVSIRVPFPLTSTRKSPLAGVELSVVPAMGDPDDPRDTGVLSEVTAGPLILIRVPSVVMPWELSVKLSGSIVNRFPASVGAGSIKGCAEVPIWNLSDSREMGGLEMVRTGVCALSVRLPTLSAVTSDFRTELVSSLATRGWVGDRTPGSEGPPIGSFLGPLAWDVSGLLVESVSGLFDTSTAGS